MMAGWGPADPRRAESHAQGTARKKNMPGRETDYSQAERGGWPGSCPSNSFCHHKTLLLATCWSHSPRCHRVHGSRQVGSIEDPAPAPAGPLRPLLCTETALRQEPRNRRLSPASTAVSFTSVLTAAGEHPPHPEPAPPRSRARPASSSSWPRSRPASHAHGHTVFISSFHLSVNLSAASWAPPVCQAQGQGPPRKLGLCPCPLQKPCRWWARQVYRPTGTGEERVW